MPETASTSDWLHLLLEATTDAFWHWDIHGEGSYWSPGLLRALGLDDGDRSSDLARLKSLLDPDDVPLVDAAVQGALEAGTPFHFECRLRHRDGSYRWFLARGRARPDDAGRPQHVIGAMTDITEQKNNEERLRHVTEVLERRVAERTAALGDSEELIRAVVETAIEAIITIDARGTIQTFNPAAERMFGYTLGEVIGRNVTMLMPSPYREQHGDYIARYLRTREPRIIGIGREVVARRKDGSTFPIELAVSQIDHKERFAGIIRDVSERHEAEERLRQADRLSAIGTLAAGLGHDMSNILLPVRARFDLIEAMELAPALREHMVEIRKSATYLQDLADGLHLLALDPDDLDATTELTQLDEWWAQVRTLLGRALPKHVRFSASLASDLPEIPVAPHRLTQAVLNLLVNAGKAVGREGRVRLWAQADDAEGIVSVGITDDGCGMTPDVKRRAFEPFFTTKTRGLGTGLGLTLVHGVVKSAGGEALIETAPGAGTTITLRFPVATPWPGVDEVDPDQPRCAVVSVRDARVDSLVRQLLEISGFAIAPNGTDHDETAALWVVQHPNEPARVVRAARAGQPVILLGPNAEPCDEPGVITIENPSDFDALRAAIGRASKGLLP